MGFLQAFLDELHRRCIGFQPLGDPGVFTLRPWFRHCSVLIIVDARDFGRIPIRDLLAISCQRSEKMAVLVRRLNSKELAYIFHYES